MRAAKLETSEYGPFYKGYIDLAGNDLLLDALTDSAKAFIDFIEDIPEGKMHKGYADGKWSIKELLVHIIDAERVFQYRALRFIRRDLTPLPGFDQDDYVPVSNANKRTKISLLDEYRKVRETTLELFRHATEEDLAFVGNTSGNPMSARALGFIIVGHEKHHAHIIKKRYL